MTSESSIDLREVIFINQRCRKDFEALPVDVLESAEEALTALQNGDDLSSKMSENMKGKFSDVEEVKIPYDTDTYRLFLYLKSPYCVMVLDAYMKKSHKKGEIPKEKIEKLEDRLKKCRYFVNTSAKLLRERFEQRQKSRDA